MKENKDRNEDNYKEKDRDKYELNDEGLYKKYSGKYSQRIECNVTNCTHNCIDDSTCRLDKIQVAPCGPRGSKVAEDETLCSSYLYIGDLNEEEKSSIKT
ncbi:MAG: DUF1540 domain-containing protein [Clostridia bacterium]|nr:DUF1540 domain-containing protein [Clostridia bacterium]